MSTYEHVHTGDVVLGQDPERALWRVVSIDHGTPQGSGYALARIPDGAVVVGYPPAGTEVVIIERADTSAEEAAAAALIGAGIHIEILGERWDG